MVAAQLPRKPPVKEFELNTGNSIPSIGFGTWKSSPKDAYDSVKKALETGYRHVDTAFNYGNEEEVGKAIKDSGVPREEIFLTTKLWSTYHTRVEENVDLSLQRLGVDYLDLYLMHWPVAMNPSGEPPLFPLKSDGSRDLQLDRHFAATWTDMEKLMDTGKVRAIGVANFDIHNLEVLRKECQIVPAVNQVELHAFLQQNKLKQYCNEKGIHITAYSPLGSSDSPLKSEKVFQDIGEKHSCDPCAVLLAWGVQAGHSVIPKSITPSRIQSNLIASKLNLSNAEMDRINSMEKGQRYCNPPWGVTVFQGE